MVMKMVVMMMKMRMMMILRIGMVGSVEWHTHCMIHD